MPDGRGGGFSRVGDLAAAGRARRAIAHNLGLRGRLVAGIERNAQRAGLTDAGLAALALRLTGFADPTQMPLPQLRHVAERLRRAAAGKDR